MLLRGAALTEDIPRGMQVSLKNLKRVEQPKPVEPEWKMCVGCNAFRAECYVPVGEGSAQMCWVCAHLHVDHDVPIDQVLNSQMCECAPHEIDPNKAPPAVLNGYYHERPQYVGRHSERWEGMKRMEPFDVETHQVQPGVIRFPHGDRRGRGPDIMHMYNQRTGCMDTYVNGEVVDSAPIAPVREDLPRRKPS